MRTSLSSLSVGFISLGCAKNLVDSQIMAGALLKGGHSLAPAPERADIVVVNTCAFIGDAREESFRAIREACRLKRHGPCRAVVVAGCLPQRYRRQLRDRFQDVDAWIGLDELDRVAALLRSAADRRGPMVQVADGARRLFEPTGPMPVFTGGPYAYLKIAEGCHHRCAFCAIPAIRGAYRSRPVRRIVREAERLLERGFRELNLISQDTTAYGLDLGDGTDLARLLRALGRIGGEFWIRLLYGYPGGISDRLLQAMADTRQVCRYLDIPVQHSHPDILRAMRRSGTIPGVESLAERLRRAMPDVALRTTCLVGFPGETAAHFENLMRFVEASEFDHLGVFVFSPEEGTPAFDLPRRPSRRTAEERRGRLMRLQQRIVRRRAHARVGTLARVLIERSGSRSPARGIGRSSREAPEVDGVVHVTGIAGDVGPGCFVDVRYTAAAGYDMKGQAIR